MSDHRLDSGSDIDIAHDEEPRETLILLQRTQDVVNKVFARFHGEAPATDAAQPGAFDQNAADQGAVEEAGSHLQPGGEESGGGDPAARRPLSVDLREVEAALREELALAGLPEQPAPWVGNTATEIAAGRTVIIDTRTA